MVLALHVGPIEFATLPFANVCELLQQMPLPVPAILDHADALGILALRDLGDVTLQAHLGAATPSEHAALYREAVSLIEQLQRRGAELAADRYVPYRIAFDVEKLTWELNFFVKHFLEGYRGITLTAAERAALDEEWAAIASELASEPRVLCHRDYHSRNLMFCDGSLHIIDFQDARLGPDTYDLVSLLRDSYVDLTDQQVEDLIAYFLALKGNRGSGGVPPAIRSDGAAAQSEGARHVWFSDDEPAESGLHPVHAADAELRAGESAPLSPIRATARTARSANRRVSLAGRLARREPPRERGPARRCPFRH